MIYGSFFLPASVYGIWSIVELCSTYPNIPPTLWKLGGILGVFLAPISTNYFSEEKIEYFIYITSPIRSLNLQAAYTSEMKTETAESFKQKSFSEIRLRKEKVPKRHSQQTHALLLNKN